MRATLPAHVIVGQHDFFFTRGSLKSVDNSSAQAKIRNIGFYVINSICALNSVLCAFSLFSIFSNGARWRAPISFRSSLRLMFVKS